VDDWFTLEKAFPDMEATLVPTLEWEARKGELSLEAEETRLLEMVQPGRTVAEVAEAAQLKSFEVCRVLFRFIRLGLVRSGARRSNDERVDDPVPEPVSSEQAQPVVVPEPAQVQEPAANAENPAKEVQSDSLPAEAAAPLAPAAGESVPEETVASALPTAQ
jgi:hypothetical protein